MSRQDDNLTPAMRQFHAFKAKHPDAILFFRMGDFYETFYEDAKVCSRVMGLTLTSRNKGSNPIPLAGVPYHAVDGYLKKMLQAGYKVAVCEQIEDPKTAKGVVKRDVIRVVTPGTLTDEMLLDEKQDNFLCAAALGAKSCAVAWVDISTGHFFCRQLPEKTLLDEIIRLQPRETLLPEMTGQLFSGEIKKLSAGIASLCGSAVTERPSWYFDPVGARTRLLKHFGTATLEGFGIESDTESVSAAGAILEYLSETQKIALTHIRPIKKISRTGFLQIDQTTLASLEVLRTIRGESSRGSLLDCIDHTLTGMGSRMIRSWLTMPLCDVASIRRRQDAVAELLENDSSRDSLRSLLKQIFDLERIAARISTFRTSPRDLLCLGSALRMIPAAREILETFSAALFKELSGKFDSMDSLADLLESAIVPSPPPHTREGGVIKTGFDKDLDRLRSISADAKSYLAEFQQAEIRRTGIANLKIGFNNVFGYYIEINHSQSDKAPADYIRRQTVKNAERYVTEQLKDYEQQILTARDQSVLLEQKLFDSLRTESAKYIPRLQSLADAIAVCDCLCSFAHLARQSRYTRPEITDSAALVITEGKHPVLAETLGAEFVPNDITLGPEDKNDLAIITGPNMAGKSTYIRQVALLVLLAQTGSFIPAKNARIGIADRIFTRVGASDELTRGQSTFMVEMTETANIINNATARSLVILDEVGRGTSTYDGLALAWAITEHIARTIKCRTLFATHYHEITELAEILDNVKNLNVAVREWAGDVVFLHKIIPGRTDKSYGIHVAKLAGIPRQIIDRSSEILAELESTFAEEASGSRLAKMRTGKPDTDTLFVQKHKSVLDKLASTDIDNLTPIEAINLLNQIKTEINQ